MNLQTNPELELAFEFVRETSTSIFLTGKAGTGKTTFLRQIKAEGGKRLVVVAPTGVAAINAGGVTIHSLFQLPFGLHVPGATRNEEHRHYSRQKVNLIRSVELLVIDEISMVRADLLDAVDAALRRFRNDERPFGNVQLLMIGDLHQLPPVVKQDEWETLSRYYDTPYFFGSQALKEIDYVPIELKHIYRQSDAEFIELLNRVRDNRLDNDTLRTINRRYVHGFQPPKDQAYITLTSTNAAAQDINMQSLSRLPGQSRFFIASIEGEFPPSFYPTEERLEFKVGAQVMFIKNDLNPEKRYFNGKIGSITNFNEDEIYVRCDGDSTEITVKPDEWKNVKYAFNEKTKEIDEVVLGRFVQYPLKLAWAITIHKSQGLTFERAIIDAQAAFAHGQVYVALSRCKSFEGIVLLSPIHYSSVKTDPVVQQYTTEAEKNLPTESQVQDAKRKYQQELIQELFSFRSIEQSLNRLRRIYQENVATLSIEASKQVDALGVQVHDSLSVISDKFQPQLLGYFDHPCTPEANPRLQERVIKAVGYFVEKLTGLRKVTSEIPTLTDNQAVRQAATSQLENLQRLLFIKQASFIACSQGFATIPYKRAQFDAELEFHQQFCRSSREDTVPAGVPHPELYSLLLKYRQEMADKHGISPRSVLVTESLRQLVMLLPTTQAGIKRIQGIASKRLKRYGSDIGAIIRNYCETNRISPDDIAKSSQTVVTSSTKQASFEMFQAGKTIKEIAAERTLSVTTIQGHLAHFVAIDQLDIERVLDPRALTDVERYCAANPSATLADAKGHFENRYGYGELRLAFSYLRKQDV